MFNLSIKQHFWINAVLGLIFTYLFGKAVLLLLFGHFDFLGLVLNGIFGYLTINSLIQNHWRPRAYPFNTKFFRELLKNNAKRW